MNKILSLDEIQITGKEEIINVEIDQSTGKKIDEILDVIRNDKNLSPELSFNRIRNLNML